MPEGFFQKLRGHETRRKWRISKKRLPTIGRGCFPNTVRTSIQALKTPARRLEKTAYPRAYARFFSHQNFCIDPIKKCRYVTMIPFEVKKSPVYFRDFCIISAELFSMETPNYSSKHRRIRNRIRTILDRVSFKFFHLKPSQRIVTIGVLLGVAALFLPWFSVGKDFSGTAFSLSLGYVGYIRVMLFASVVFVVFSYRTKSEIKSRSGFSVSDYTFCFFVATALFSFDFASINVIRGFSIFTKDVTIGNGPALSLVASLGIAL